MSSALRTGLHDMKVLLDGLAFPESPRVYDGQVYVSDWGAGQVLRGDGEVIATVESFPMCIDFLPDGRLLIIDNSGPRLLVQERDGTLTTYADLSGVSEMGFNDITVDRHGHVFVNCVGFEFPGGVPTTGIVAVVTPDGRARQVADDVFFPNGMAVTGETLLVAESYRGQLTAFDIAGDGSLSNRRVWAAVEGSAPDGICMSPDGSAWFAEVPGARCVRVAEGGEVLQEIKLDRGAFSCALGDGVLYVATNAWGGVENVGQGGPNGQLVAITL